MGKKLFSSHLQFIMLRLYTLDSKTKKTNRTLGACFFRISYTYFYLFLCVVGSFVSELNNLNYNYDRRYKMRQK